MRLSLIAATFTALLGAGAFIGSPVRAGGDEPPPIWPIAVAATGYTCDTEGDVVSGTEPWPTETLVVIPMRLAGPGGSAGSTGPHLQAGRPSDDAVSSLAFIQPVHPWEYATATGGVNSGNLEEALDARAGLGRRLLMADAWCGTSRRRAVRGPTRRVGLGRLVDDGDVHAQLRAPQRRPQRVRSGAEPGVPDRDIRRAELAVHRHCRQPVRGRHRVGVARGHHRRLRDQPLLPIRRGDPRPDGKVLANAFDLPPTDVDAFTDDDDLVTRTPSTASPRPASRGAAARAGSARAAR